MVNDFQERVMFDWFLHQLPAGNFTVCCGQITMFLYSE
jgi:hypothetical protein